MQNVLRLAIIAVLLCACAPITEAEKERRRYEREDRMVQCRDFMRLCPTTILVNDPWVSCGQDIRLCPDIPTGRRR